jgi:hypothetical protein
MMKLISYINIRREGTNAAIQLLQGDLSQIPREYTTDILVMAAFPGDYIALPGSLMLALKQKGLSVESMANDKETDLREQLGCWLSKPLSPADQQKFNFRRVLCFEPGDSIREPREVVGNIFRCINSFVFDDDNNVVAMPIIGTGYQKVPVEKMLPALLEACYFWLQSGLPLETIRIVVQSEEKTRQALDIFNAFKHSASPGDEEETLGVEDDQPDQPEPKAEPVKPLPADTGYDYFLSYAHVHAKEVQYFVEELKSRKSTLSIFYDKDSIPPGGLWIQQISAAIQRTSKVLVFLSPDYDKSPVCWDEFQCAKLMEYNRRQSIIQTVYLYGHKTTEMPLIMGIYSYIDCREGSREKIKACIDQLLK